MAVRTREEIMESIRTRIGDSTEDEDIAFLEDISDTFDDMESRASGDGEDWKTKYEENDKEWRRKYTERFFSKGEDPEDPEEEEEEEESKTFEDLFEEENK